MRGRVVASPSPFTDAPLGFGWAWDDLDEPYSAGVDALYFNEGFTQIVVYGGGRPGAKVRAVTRPATTYPHLIVRATTVSPVAAADTLTAQPAIIVGQDSSHTGVLVSGTIAGWESLPAPAAGHTTIGLVAASQATKLGDLSNDIAQPTG